MSSLRIPGISTLTMIDFAVSHGLPANSAHCGKS
jgi:hypothetical protein